MASVAQSANWRDVDPEPVDSFDLNREHATLIAIFVLKDEIRRAHKIHEPCLQMAASHWHKAWTHRTDQLHDLCVSFRLIRGEIEGNLFRARMQRRRPAHSIDMLLNALVG